MNLSSLRELSPRYFQLAACSVRDRLPSGIPDNPNSYLMHDHFRVKAYYFVRVEMAKLVAPGRLFKMTSSRWKWPSWLLSLTVQNDYIPVEMAKSVASGRLLQ